jgi:hypothetical protein
MNHRVRIEGHGATVEEALAVARNVRDDLGLVPPRYGEEYEFVEATGGGAKARLTVTFVPTTVAA